MRDPAAADGDALDRARTRLVFEDDFDAPHLDATRWVPHYLPPWSTPDRSAARYRIADSTLQLRVDADQLPWCPELDGDLRVSSIQTGVRSGPIGSTDAQHRFSPRALVRTAYGERRLYTPAGGLVEIRMRAIPDPLAMVALWMIGFEDLPERSGELCVAEIFGREVEPRRARVGMGVHPFGDPTLADDFERVELALDATGFHVYAASWGRDGAAWYVDDRLVRTAAAAPAYPLQLMLGAYAFPPAAGAPPDTRFPKVFEVDWIRGWAPGVLGRMA